jgi:hypothetical protein
MILFDDHSLAKWKRESEGWYKQDTAMLEGLFRTAEENVVRKCLTYILQYHDDGLFCTDKGR